MAKSLKVTYPQTYEEFCHTFPKLRKTTDKYGRIGYPCILRYEVVVGPNGKTILTDCPPKSEDFPDLGALVPPSIATAAGAKAWKEWVDSFEKGELTAPGKPYFVRVYNLELWTMLWQFGFWSSKEHTGKTYEIVDNRRAPGA